MSSVVLPLMPSNAFSSLLMPLRASSWTKVTSFPVSGSTPFSSFWYSNSSGRNSSPRWRTTPDWRRSHLVPSRSSALSHQRISRWKALHVCGDPSHVGTFPQAPPLPSFSLSAISRSTRVSLKELKHVVKPQLPPPTKTSYAATSQR